MLTYCPDELEGAQITCSLKSPNRLAFGLGYEDLKKNGHRHTNAMVRVYSTPPNWRWVSVTVTIEDCLGDSDIYLVKCEVLDIPAGGK